MRCTICGEKIKRDSFAWRKQAHFHLVHPSYGRWFGRWARNFFGLLIAFVGVLVLVIFLSISYGGVYVPLAVIAILALFAFCIYEIDYLLRRTHKRYVKEWKDQHDPTSSQGPPDLGK